MSEKNRVSEGNGYFKKFEFEIDTWNLIKKK